MLSRLFHIAINAADLDRSVQFYRRLGFQVLSEREVASEQLAAAFAVPNRECRFVHLRLGDDEAATVLDVVQWSGPPTADGPGVLPQNQRGLTRFAVLTDDTDRIYRELSEAGVGFLTEPTTVLTPAGGWRVCLATDPDGVVVQITELVPAPVPDLPAPGGLLDWDRMIVSELLPGITAAMAAGDRLSAVRYTLGAGAVVPQHEHDSEEFGQVISGSLVLSWASRTSLLTAGQGFLVPGGARHGARAGEQGCELLECYAPSRIPAPGLAGGAKAGRTDQE